MSATKKETSKAPPKSDQMCAACDVRCAALFGTLKGPALARVQSEVEDIELSANDRIYGPGDAGKDVYTVRSGMVRFERHTEGGDLRIVRVAGRGDLIGLEALLQRPYNDEALCCGPVKLCRIPCALIDKLADEQGALRRELMLRWQTTLEASETWVANLATGPARRRMLRLLARLSELGLPDGTIWLPRREKIGAMLDLTFETASRLVSQMRREGVLDLTTPRMARVNAQALREAMAAQDAEGRDSAAV